MDRIGLICRYIKEDPRSTQRDLAQKTGFSVGTVNTLIKEAMQQRLIAQGKSVAGTYELTGAGDAFLEQFRVDGALIIAAGFGSRFVPLTFETPKGLLEVFGERMIRSSSVWKNSLSPGEIRVPFGMKISSSSPSAVTKPKPRAFAVNTPVTF